MRKKRPAGSDDLPPPLELACLKALWELGEGTVHDVRRVLSKDRVLAYTTVMTLLDRLEKRGCASRRKPGRSFLYRPKSARDTMRDKALKQLLDGFFDGSADALLGYLRGPRKQESSAGSR